MSELTETQRQHIIDLLDEGKELPQDYKHLLFPSQRKECELVYADKQSEEDILAETMALPLQPIRSYGNSDSNWHNILIFGDNLQAMKTLLSMKEQGKLVNADGSYGTKLVYIDPPFGIGDQHSYADTEIAYSALIQQAKFIEFLRRRLILIRELLAPNGTVFVRLDHHFGHAIKIIMDEVFGEQNFRNEIIINRVHKKLRNLKKLNISTESLYLYSKSGYYFFSDVDVPRVCNFCGSTREPIWEDMTSPGLRNPPQRVIFGRTYLPRRGRHFMYTQEKIDMLIKEGRLRINTEIPYNDLQGNRVDGRPEYLQTSTVPLDNNWTDIKGYAFANNYPTENHEDLLTRVIQIGSAPDDIVLDAFAGAGTTLAVAEKLGRRWIGIDCSKQSIYTIQRRFFNLRDNKTGKIIKPQPFTLYNAGLYDFSKLQELPWNGWRFFALNLFQCRDEPHRVGIDLDGYRGIDDVLVFNHTINGGVVLDYGFIDDLHAQIGSRLRSRFFIIAPAASVTFLEDYIDKENTRYYILRIPYSIIDELHHREFGGILQAVDEKQVNDIREPVGFDFIRQPKVECSYSIRPRSVHFGKSRQEAVVKIQAFKSEAMAKGASQKADLETLSMVLVDYDYSLDANAPGKGLAPHFQLNEVFYAQEIQAANWEVRMPLESLGSHIMLIYIDIYANEYVEVKSLSDFYSCQVTPDKQSSAIKMDLQR